MIRKKKKYSKPRKMYDLLRIEEENELVKRYGLKSKREIWKADYAVSRIRRLAKALITASSEKQEELIKKLNKIGFKADKIADALALNKEDWLKRRLQSILIGKGIAKPKEARQLITHKHVLINDKIVNIPSYLVGVDEENKIIVRKSLNQEKNKEKIKFMEKNE